MTMKWRNFLAILVCNLSLFLVSNWPSKAFACDTIENATLDSSCVVMAREGQRGVWFSLSEAERLRKASLIVPELQLQIKKFEESEIEKNSEVSNLREALKLQKESTATLESTVETYVKETREAKKSAAEAREELDAWYRSWWFLTSLGAAIGGVTLAIVL